MNKLAVLHGRTADKPSAASCGFTRGALVQRSCACGGTGGATGECEDCAKRHGSPEAGEREHPSASGSLVRRDGFACLAIHPGATARRSFESGDREEPILGILPDERASEVVEQSTGGSSQCNLAGDAQTISNNNDECTRPCTQEHEEDHVRHRSSCCEAARAAYHAASTADDRSRVMRRWNEWVRTNRAASECSAYRVSVACATRMQGDHNCANESSECCDQISSYLAHVTERSTHYCDQSGGSTDRTACPEFSSP